MAYSFKLDEDLTEGLHRIGQEQLHRALLGLEAAPGADAVHGTRKCIKRLRALLRLVRPAIGNAAFKRDNARLGDASRLLSQARDQTVLRLIVAQLSATSAEQKNVTALAALDRIGSLLGNDRSPPPKIDDTSLDRARTLLADVARDWTSHSLQPDDFDALSAGLGNAHRRCRETMATAYAALDDATAAPAESDDAFHEWRKAVQWHWRHMRLLAASWPELAAARIAQAKELSEMLGRAQDLAVFAAFVEAAPERAGERAQTKTSGTAGSVGLLRKQKKLLIGIAREQQAALRAAAQPRAARLFAEGSKGHVRRMAIYWTTAVEMERTPVQPAPLAPKPVPRKAKPTRRRISKARGTKAGAAKPQDAKARR